MSYISQIPTLNELQFVPSDEVIPARYHSLPMDKQLFSDGFKEWQTQRTYVQKKQQGDRIYIELHRQDNNDVEYYWVNCNGVRVSDDQLAQFVIYSDVSGSVYTKPDGTEIPLTVHKWILTPSAFDLDDGVYHIVIPVKFYEEDTVVATKTWISEPIDLRTSHDDTIYIQYFDDTNKHDIIWKFNEPTGFKGDTMISPKFGIRVEGCIEDVKEFTSNDVYFKEQDYEQRNLSSYAWNVKEVYIGEGSGVQGIPPYLLDKLNHAFSCDNIYIEGRRYVKNDGAEWELDEADYYPLYTTRIKIRDYDRQDSFTDNRGVNVLVGTLPSDYPYYAWSILNPATGQYLFNTGIEITDAGDVTDFVDYLNEYVTYYWGLYGTFSVDSNLLYYQNEPFEDYTFSLVLLTSFVTLTVPVTVATATFTVGNKNGTVGVIWGDAEANTNIAQSGTEITVSHPYASTATYTVRVYMSNYIDKLSLICTSASRATAITGALSGNCAELYIYAANFGALNPTFINSARLAIRRVTLFVCGITSFTTPLFAINPQGSIFLPTYFNWSFLQSFSLNTNAMNVSQVNTFINDIYVNLWANQARSINLLMSPAAAPTGTALTQKATRNSQGWTIVTN